MVSTEAAGRHGADLLLHRLLGGSLIAKGGFAVLEISLGIALAVVNLPRAVAFVERIALREIGLHPHDAIANFLLHTAQAASPEMQRFYAWYLALHGFAKLGIVAGLWRGTLWTYPASVLALTTFIAYQLHLYFANGNPAMLALAIFDLFVAMMVIREWRQAVARLAAF